MKRFRVGHIVLLTVLIIIGAATDAPAKTVAAYPRINYFDGTQWRVTRIDGVELPETNGDITISFTADAAIYVDQGCKAFMAYSDGNGGLNTEPARHAILCDVTHKPHTLVIQLFENFERFTPIGDDRFQLTTTNGHSLTATRLPVVNSLPEPIQGGLIVRPVMSTPLTIELDGPKVFQDELARCEYTGKTDFFVPFQFKISWGDGTVSDLQSGPVGAPCKGIARHTYANPGQYHVTVTIDTIGPADGLWPIYFGDMDVTLL